MFKNRELFERVLRELMAIQFRRYSRGWFEGYIIESVDMGNGMFAKRMKRVNPRITIRFYTNDYVSKYPYELTKAGDCDKLHHEHSPFHKVKRNG